MHEGGECRSRRARAGARAPSTTLGRPSSGASSISAPSRPSAAFQALPRGTGSAASASIWRFRRAGHYPKTLDTTTDAGCVTPTASPRLTKRVRSSIDFYRLGCTLRELVDSAALALRVCSLKKNVSDCSASLLHRFELDLMRAAGRLIAIAIGNREEFELADLIVGIDSTHSCIECTAVRASAQKARRVSRNNVVIDLRALFGRGKPTGIEGLSGLSNEVINCTLLVPL